MDFIAHSDYIRELVAEQDAKDANWKWSVEGIGLHHILIRWGYLDYLDESENCFRVELDADEISYWILTRKPYGDLISTYLVAEQPNPRVGAEQTIQAGLRDAIAGIAYLAHSQY